MNLYTKSGVNLKIYNKLIKNVNFLIKKAKKKEENINKDNSFSALFDFSKIIKEYNQPVIVSSSDGVGTKLLIAQESNNHGYIGIDLVAMCVNDLLAQGAKPLFFLDYFATGSLNKKTLLSVIKGIIKGCKKAKIELIGGETAEMPGMYNDNHYDLAGFVIGIIDKNNILPKYNFIKEGDHIIGLESSGVHSNGFSLIRYIFKNLGINYNDLSPWNNKTWSEILLKPTKIYVESILPIIPNVKGIAHITGGGLTYNISRIIPKNLFFKIDIDSWKWQDIFLWLIKEGKIKKKEMLKTFNCGIGMVLVIDPSYIENVKKHFQKYNQKIKIIGTVHKKLL